MLTHPTLEQLRQLKLNGMADAFVDMSKQDATADLGHAEWLGLLVECDATIRVRFRVNLDETRRWVCDGGRA